jgi:hypothetical protein
MDLSIAVALCFHFSFREIFADGLLPRFESRLAIVSHRDICLGFPILGSRSCPARKIGVQGHVPLPLIDISSLKKDTFPLWLCGSQINSWPALGKCVATVKGRSVQEEASSDS